MNVKVKATIIDSEGLARTLTRLAHEIIEKNKGTKGLAIIGLRTRGDFIARRIAAKIEEIEGTKLEIGTLDVSLYRDDFRIALKHPEVQLSEISFDIDGKHVILIDDVLYTGRTIRAALDALMDYGRPASIQLAVLVDRGHREIPIAPDYTGKNIPTSIGEEVRVKMTEIDDEDCVLLVDVEA
ncbi:bifunctional pyr operon transcriptional regulator/uracil phosphoribosyltransferase PyrR [Candidatus Marinimicrobia bacterium MT.SAG.3]|nr:bifunctional pyr operon transcriptional regulator/uracil phosphoribosyltransferase PyrR [Candidatus Marinimicrobia bacterium MT.SAG.3]